MEDVVRGFKSRIFALSVVFVFIMLLIFALLGGTFLFSKVAADPPVTGGRVLSEAQEKEIEDYIRAQVHKGKIPGLAVMVVQGDKTVFEHSMGFSNIKKQERVNSATLFEIGANSKAFTGLGILWLQRQGKLDLNDKVADRLPWFRVSYERLDADEREKKDDKYVLRIKHLLYHTSGIPFETFAKIPESEASNALEETVRSLVGIQLMHAPGTEFAYATINYDILGLIIQEVSGQDFEVFMKENILGPLGLHKTFLSRTNIVSPLKVATGYKISLFVPAECNAPVYRGNTPAGYFISSTDELNRWMKIQLAPERVDLPTDFLRIIRESHKPNESVLGFRYVAGWFVFRREEIFHSGNNPNYSSMILLSRPEKWGIAVLANLNTGRVENIAWGILGILKKLKKPPGTKTAKTVYLPVETNDFFIHLDRLAFGLILFFGFLLVFSIWKIVKVLKLVVKEKRALDIKGIPLKNIAVFLVLSVFLGFYIYYLFKLPSLLSYDLPWGVAAVWAPATFPAAAIIAGAAGVFGYLYGLLKLFFPTPNSNDKEVKHAIPRPGKP